MKTDEARKLICFYLRQLDGGYYPLKIRQTPKLLELVDAPTAQNIYEEEIALIEARSGPLPRWDSEKNAPVAGTPKP
jgi:hypothetical protein